VSFRDVAELQALLEGVRLPAGKGDLVDYARAERARAELLILLERLPQREYRSLDEVGEALQPVQPSSQRAGPRAPRPESGLPPGGEAYTDPSGEPGSVRERGPG
jgi:Protein of unknown function (DUF2795)